MNWWQSLLIALVPAVITAGITLAISLLQNNKTKLELLKKYQLEQSYHISQTRFDMEFAIYKEISEKIVSLAIFIQNLFPQGIYQEPIDETAKHSYYEELHRKTCDYLDEANLTINKYAIFINEEWYNRFLEIKALCVTQAKLFNFLRVNKSSLTPCKEADDALRGCFARTKEISDKFDGLIKDLRKYIQNMDIKEKANAD